VVPGPGLVLCQRPTATHLGIADAQWAPQRKPGDAHDWSWARVAVDSHDDFCVLDPSHVPLALWCSHAPRVLDLPGGRAYRLDFIEVKPELRGAELGVFTLGLVACRALECGVTRLVLGSLPEARKLYDKTGGRQSKVRGWRPPRGLLPYEFERKALEELREAIDELEQKGEEVC